MFSKKYITVTFLCLFFIPLIDGLFHISPLLITSKNTENRTLALKVEMDINNLDKFPMKYESYYNDHFMMRDVFISWYNRIRAVYFGVSPIPEKAIIGKSGWLFFTGDELPLYSNTKHLSVYDMDFILKEFERRKKHLQQKNCEMYIFIVPPKSLVYPEYLSDLIQENYLKTNGLILTEYIKKNSQISITYLLQEFLDAKNKDKPALYLHTDNHWSEYGGYIGSNAITKVLSITHKELQPIDEAQLVLKDTAAVPGNIATMIGIQDDVMEHTTLVKLKKTKAHFGKEKGYPVPVNIPAWEYERVREVDNTKLPKMLMMDDSFGSYFIPFLSENFSHSTYLFDSWRYGLNDSIINIEKPDIVIYEIFESNLKNLLYN